MFENLGARVIELSSMWQLYEALFCRSPDVTDLLNNSGSNVFASLQWLLLDNCVLTLCKLTDPDNGHRNLTFEQLIKQAKESDPLFSVEKATDSLNELKDGLRKVRKVRNKAVAHLDLRTALRVAEGVPKLHSGIVPPIMRSTLLKMEALLNFTGLHFGHPESAYADPIPCDSAGPYILVRVLRKGHSVSEKLHTSGDVGETHDNALT